MIRALVSKWRNRKVLNGLAKAEQQANRLFNDKKSVSVMCIYCRNLLLRKDAVYVYNIERDEAEFSHEECWSKNNKRN